MHQHDVIVLRLNGRKRASHRFLTAIAAFDHGDATGELMRGDDSLDPFDLCSADRHHDGAHLGNSREGAQAVDQDGEPGE